VLRRPLWLRVPAQVLQRLLGEMAEIFVGGQHVAPTRALQSGFEFRYPHLAHALRQLLGRPRQRLAMGAPPEAPAVYYNGDCPVCSAEMGTYAAHCARTGLDVHFIDACRHPNELTEYGLFRDHLERRLYMKTADGRVYSGIEALVLLWGRMPGYRWLAVVVGNRAVKPLAELFYDHALSPTLYRWALRRQMGKRTGLSASG
jgi:predicted DCC family thiol-disulfide oxidoreductase YuxK